MPEPMSDAELDGLSKELVDWYIRWNPSFATHAGIHEYDHLMPRATYEAELEERSHVKGFLHRLEGIDRKTLARCYWRLGRFKESQREFRAALNRAGDPTDSAYLTLCLETVTRELQ